MKMKILELRFKNLNSLYGEWFIDFSSPEYVSNGIFALTGPTGSGKSTILDAICLALYGTTPRLGKITKSSNEIMSRQTGECYAEVLFESRTGRFRCHWAQHRARKKSDGKLTDTEHQISDEKTGRLLETKKSLVTGIIEEKTGMDFDRFTRSILLAQGRVDTFLKAGTEQKSRILEQITGTEIYSEISRAVHDRLRDERDNLNLLEAETTGILILDPEEEKQIQQELESRQKQETEVSVQKTETHGVISRLTVIENLRSEICSLSEEHENLQREIDAFKPEGKRLEEGLKAAELEGKYATLFEVRKQQESDKASLESDTKALPELERSLLLKEEAFAASEKQTRRAKEDLKSAGPLIQKVRSLDQNLTNLKQSLDTGNSAIQRDNSEIGKLERQKLDGTKTLDAIKQELISLDKYFRENARDEKLIGSLTGIKAQLEYLSSKQIEISLIAEEERQAAENLKTISEKIKDGINRFELYKQKLNDTVKALEKKKNDLNSLLGSRLLREYRSDKENLLRELALHTRITELEEYRRKLEDGKPCPLCGAEKHPYAEGNIPARDANETKIKALTDLIEKAEMLETIIKKMEGEENESRQKLTESEKKTSAAAGVQNAASGKKTDLTERFLAAQKDYSKLAQPLSAELKSFGLELSPESLESEIPVLLSALEKRLNLWQKQTGIKTDQERHRQTRESELQQINAVIDTQKSTLDEKKQNLEENLKEYTSREKERRKLFDNKSPDAEEERLHTLLAGAEGEEKELSLLRNQARQEINSITTGIASLTKRLKDRLPELQELESAFRQALHLRGFSDEDQFLEARIPDSEREELKTKASALENRKIKIQTMKTDRENSLQSKLAVDTGTKTLSELETLQKELEKQLSTLLDSIGGLKQKLSENAAAGKRRKEKQDSIIAHKNECHRWEKLHSLIGSADGKKFRNFAQGLTFDQMISHANRQLENMTDRYLLIRDEKQPLELNVIDNYQAGEIRSTRNLSGGESFIVSLTLALGLSKMASRKVRVDSLFLDEGFGSLDEEALDTALETLSGLHQEGKLIGIISHVSALKERIGTQISVTPASGGKSKLSGPGCRRIG